MSALRLVYVICRTNDYRTLATLIREGINRGHYVEIWHDCAESYLRPRVESSPFFSSKFGNVVFKEFFSDDEILENIRNSANIDYFISSLDNLLDKGLTVLGKDFINFKLSL